MIPLEVSRQPDGVVRARCGTRYGRIEAFLDDDLRDTGGHGLIEEVFGEIRDVRAGKRRDAKNGGDLIYFTLDAEWVELGRTHSTRKERVTVDDFIDVVLRWFEFTNIPLAQALKVIIGVPPGLTVTMRMCERLLWEETRDSDYPWETWTVMEHWCVHMGDFPAEDLYTLIVDGRAVTTFNDWPTCWVRQVSGNATAT